MGTSTSTGLVQVDADEIDMNDVVRQIVILDFLDHGVEFGFIALQNAQDRVFLFFRFHDVFDITQVHRNGDAFGGDAIDNGRDFALRPQTFAGLFAYFFS